MFILSQKKKNFCLQALVVSDGILKHSPAATTLFYNSLISFLFTYLFFTCIVKTPSSCEESFFICSAKTWASSRIEKSVSAPQDPQADRAEQMKTRRHNEPRWRALLLREAALALGVKAPDLSAVRLAMTVGGSQAGGTRRVEWWRKNTNFKGTSFTTSLRRVRPSSGARLQHFQQLWHVLFLFFL